MMFPLCALRQGTHFRVLPDKHPTDSPLRDAEMHSSLTSPICVPSF